MADEERGRELPQRVRGAAGSRAAPPTSSSLPKMSEELRQRMQAAVQAERAEVTAEEQTTESQRHATGVSGSAGGDVATQPAKHTNGHAKRSSKLKSADTRSAAKPQFAAQAPPAAKPAPAAEPAAKPEPVVRPAPATEEDEVTEWIRPQPAGPNAGPGLPKPAMYGHGGVVGREAAAAPARTGRQAPKRPGVPEKPRRRRRGTRVAARVAILVVVLAALAVAAVVHFDRMPGPAPTSAAVRHQQAVARNQAAAWVARQVSRDALVSCDRVMCAALTAHGFPLHDLLVLGSTSPVPSKSAVVVETATVQGLFGSSLATAWSPAVLASFGSGQAQVTVRVVAPNGAAAYQTLLNADLAKRKAAGAGMVNDSQINVPAPASQELTGGQVDSRLLLALADLAGQQPIRIVQFGDPGPGASVGIPLRFVDLAENVPASKLGPAAYVKAVRAYLSTASTKFRPATMTTVVLNGQAVLRVEFTAPSPLGVFG